MENTVSRSKKISIALFSLALHMMLFLLLFVSLTDPTTRKQLLQRQRIELLKKLAQVPKQKFKWAATKARASQFGAPVVFANPTQQQQTTYEKKSGATQKQTQLIQKIALQQTEQKKITKEKIIKEGKVDKPQKQEIQPKLVKKDTIQQVVQKETIPKPLLKPELQKPKTSLTLAQITKGFLEQIKGKGDHTVTMHGDKNRLPTDEQLKHERYLQRLQWCLQNSMKIHQGKYTPHQSVKTSLDMFIALDKDGKLTELTLLRSSGIAQLDEFMLFAFQDASSSFPPVPEFFKKELYSIIFTVKVNEMPQPGFRLFMQ